MISEEYIYCVGIMSQKMPQDIQVYTIQYNTHAQISVSTSQDLRKDQDIPVLVDHQVFSPIARLQFYDDKKEPKPSAFVHIMPFEG